LAISPLLWAQTGDTTDLSKAIRDRQASVDLELGAQAGYVRVRYSPIGGSSGAAVRVEVERLPAAGPRDPLYFSLPPGMRLGNSTSSEQAMVVGGVLGRAAGAGRYEPNEQIVVGDTPVSYEVEAYCSEFHKDNPSTSSSFRPERTDPALACVLDQGRLRHLSISAKQAAVWQYTDRIGFDEMAHKFPVTAIEWASAGSVVDYCQTQAPRVPAQNGRQRRVDTAAEVIGQGVDTVFSEPSLGPQNAVMFLVSTVLAMARLTDPTPGELAIWDKAAHVLLGYDRKPASMGDAEWAKGSAQFHATAKTALLLLARLPGNQASARKDWTACEAADTKALQTYPDDAMISFQLGTCLRQDGDGAENRSQAAYEFQRAAVIDATLGGSGNAATITKFADVYYATLHGSAAGLAELKEAVKGSALPPAGFKVRTAAEEEEKRFAESNPQLAAWTNIKAALAAENGQQFFGGMKDAWLPKLKGTLVGARPACRPRELIVAVPLPGGKYTPEVTLKLVEPINPASGTPEVPGLHLVRPAALAGKPELNVEFEWEGIATAFTSQPFMLTMTVEKSKVAGLKTSPCTVAPAGGKKVIPVKE
jgi:hypothetical protein